MKTFQKLMFLGLIACVAMGSNLLAMAPINVELTAKEDVEVKLAEVNVEIKATKIKIIDLKQLIINQPWGAHSFNKHLKREETKLNDLEKQKSDLEKQNNELAK